MTKKKLTLESAQKNLEKLVRDFEENNVPIEKAPQKFQEAIELANFIKKRLTQIENQIEEIQVSFEDENEL